MLDDRRPVEDVQLLEDAQLTTVVAEAGLENEFQAKLTEKVFALQPSAVNKSINIGATKTQRIHLD